MKKCVPVLLFSVLSASVASHADSNVFQQKAEKTKTALLRMLMPDRKYSVTD